MRVSRSKERHLYISRNGSLSFYSCPFSSLWFCACPETNPGTSTASPSAFGGCAYSYPVNKQSNDPCRDTRLHFRCHCWSRPPVLFAMADEYAKSFLANGFGDISRKIYFLVSAAKKRKQLCQVSSIDVPFGIEPLYRLALLLFLMSHTIFLCWLKLSARCWVSGNNSVVRRF
ncbi:hypothetical protein K432DRAFT_108801 [Lepidopterella palustris CBS 459.81]|uniref:Uncharacterized protein n=1 Tax=Lepidopterella palustris CBS 459.81 TaxID=1314670 RepID=A0A8E2E615_9PEZI|nr:hypothetical protein K432DRAFT_108801 [Lepidopterella palustris CBS 459.81]